MEVKWDQFGWPDAIDVDYLKCATSRCRRLHCRYHQSSRPADEFGSSAYRPVRDFESTYACEFTLDWHELDFQCNRSIPKFLCHLDLLRPCKLDSIPNEFLCQWKHSGDGSEYDSHDEILSSNLGPLENSSKHVCYLGASVAKPLTYEPT